MNSDFLEFALAELANCEDVFPVSGIAGMTFFTAIGAGVEKIRWRCLQVQVEALIGIGGKESDRLVLKDQIADAV